MKHVNMNMLNYIPPLAIQVDNDKTQKSFLNEERYTSDKEHICTMQLKGRILIA